MFTKSVIKAYKKKFLVRHDPDGSIFYFSHTDFPGMACEPFSFKGERGQHLQGYFYTKNVTRPDRLIVFDHGMGCGHKAYMREIDVLTDHGYTVFAYDHTGTLASGGDNIGGFSQSLCDLDHAIKALKAAGKTEGKRIAVMGHSWGGFSTMNIGAFHKDITHLVALSGFTSPIYLLRDKLKGYAEAVFKVEVEYFGGYAFANSALSLIETDAKALIVHSEDDPRVPYHRFAELRGIIGESERITFMPVNGKKHNPNYTEDAVKYRDKYFADRAKLKKKRASKEARAAFTKSCDWYKMTEQDMDFWAKVFDFIDG